MTDRNLPGLPIAELDSIEDLVEYAQANPIWWLGVVFGVKPWAKQTEIIESVRDNAITMVKSCHAIGKSWVAARIALWFLFTHPNSIVFTTAPTMRQVREILWREIRDAYKSAKMPLGGDGPLLSEINLGPKWFAFGFTSDSDNPTAAQGMHADYVLGIVDEACGIEDPIWDAINANLSSGAVVRLLGIGNPTDIATKFAKYFDRTDISTISVSAFDTPNFTTFGITIEDYRQGTWKQKVTGPLPYPFLINPQYVQEQFVDAGENSPSFKARVKAEFPFSNEEALISPEWIKLAVKRWKDDYRWEPGTPHAIGADVGRQGNDSSVAVRRTGTHAKTVKTWQGAEGIELGNGLVTIGRMYQTDHGAPPIAIDAIGVGTSPYDQIRSTGYPCIGLINSEASSDPAKWLNKRAEHYWHLRDQFRGKSGTGEDGTIAIPPWEKLMIEELEQVKYLFTKKGIIQIEDKEKLKQRLKRSPDHMDALVNAFAEEVEAGIAKFMNAGGLHALYGTVVQALNG